MISLRRIKFLYEIYNFFHYRKLKYQFRLYRKYGIKKLYFRSLSSADLPEDSPLDHPYLDRVDSASVFTNLKNYSTLDEEVRKSIIDWSSKGCAILPAFFSWDRVDEINALFNTLMDEKKLRIKDKRKIMNAVRYSEKLRNLVNPPRLTEILKMLMGIPVQLFQSVNFIRGSEDAAHADIIHLSTYPYGYLLAVWIALEDIDADNGPLYYYPGSHRLPYVMNRDFNHGGTRWLLGKEYKDRYAKKIASVLAEHQFEKKLFTAKKGDVLIWHANLLHGGEKVKDPNRTRISMVLHYFGIGVIRYHEISERPSLLKPF